MQPTGMERLSLLIVFLLCLAATAIAQNCGKLEAGLVLTIFAVASGAFVEQVMIIVHLPRIVKATVDLLCILDRKQTQIKHKQADLRGSPKPGTSTETADCILLEE
jgi:hypothetical protein